MLCRDDFDPVAIPQFHARGAAFFDLAFQDGAGEFVGNETRDRSRDVARSAARLQTLAGEETARIPAERNRDA